MGKFTIQRYLLFKKFPRLYDWIITAFGYKRAIGRLLNKFDFDGIVSDLGCGSGLLSIFIAKRNRNCRVIAVDKSNGLLKILHEYTRNERIKNIDLVKADLSLGIPIKEDSLDFVVTSGLIEYIDPENLFKEVYKTIKSDGKLLVLVIRNNIFGKILGKIFGFKPHNLRYVLDLLQTSGFEEIKVMDMKDLRGLNKIKICIISRKTTISFRDKHTEN